jgi:hypothetical protein
MKVTLQQSYSMKATQLKEGDMFILLSDFLPNRSLQIFQIVESDNFNIDAICLGSSGIVTFQPDDDVYRIQITEVIIQQM